MSIYTPSWMKKLLYITLIVFPFFAFYMLYMAYDMYHNSGWVNASLCIFAVVYLSFLPYKSIRLLKYSDFIIDFDNKGFKIKSYKDETVYAWKDIAYIKNRKLVKILELFDKNGDLLFVLDHKNPMYEEFEEKVFLSLNKN